jgi:hypothetical protein
VDNDIWLDEAKAIPKPPTEPACDRYENPVDEEPLDGDNCEGHRSDIADTWISAEFWYREKAIHDEAQWPIHHFNWYGNPIRERSETHTAHSLWYILSGPKTPGPRDENRFLSILNRACQMVDPVIYTGDIDVLSRAGQDLVNAVIGKVFKFYTPHGCWQDDTDDRDEEAVEDKGAMEVYRSCEWVVANGFYDHPLVPTRNEKSVTCEEDSSHSDAWAFLRKRSRPYVPSSLQLSRHPDTDICSMNPGKVRRVSGKYQWLEAANVVDCISSVKTPMLRDS